MGLRTFKGGVHPFEGKVLSKDKPVEESLPKGDLVFPVSQHIGAPANPVVAVGDTVKKGQLIAEAGGFVSANIYSSVSGTVKSIALHRVATGDMVNSIVIENDGNYEEVEYDAVADVMTLSKEEIIEKVKKAGVVGMGGAGFPTCVKLNPPPGKRCEFLIVNGAECEPYLCADHRVMIERADRIRTGVEIMRRVLGDPAVRIAVEANKPEAIAALERVFADIAGDVEIVVLPVLYPQGSEKHQI